MNLVFYDSAGLIPENHWEQVVASKNIYLTLPYLKALEQAQPGEMQFRYILFYDTTQEPVAAAAVQILQLEQSELIKYETFCNLGDQIKNKLLSKLDFRLMVCGNVFCCGENGFAHTDALPARDAYQELSAALNRLRQAEKADGPVSMVLLKEFWPESFAHSDALKTSGFRDFCIDVNMILPIHSGWKTMDDYLASMTTKFRTKAKGVFKKSAEIRSVDFSKEDISRYRSEIEELYHSVVEKADFKFGELNGQAFYNFKARLGDRFMCRGYFLGEKLVGFSTAFYSDGYMDANYVGLDYEFNHSHAIYQRMLYDFVELAIQKGMKRLCLGRTAEEIKSCLGAEPTDMKLYLRHRNTISNTLLSPVIASISPSEFVVRKPFRADFIHPGIAVN